ncbi:MAG: L-fucose/L-arabinose isomerase family protein [Thermoproteota archaeon]
MIRLFKEECVDGIIIMAVDFGDEVSAARIASSLLKPVILFATKEPPFTAEGERISDSFCGTISIGSALYRRKIPFVWGGVVSPEEEGFAKTIEDFARTCIVVNGFLKARIGLVGPRPESFETCALDEVTLIRVFNQRVIPISLVEAGAVAENIDSSEINRITQSIRREVDASAVNEETLIKIGRLEYALLALADRWRLDAMGIQCWGPMYHVFGVAPCHVSGRLVDRGIMVACEADVLGALTMLIQYLASFKKTPPHFIDWTVQHREKENVFLAWHCGNAPPSLARDRAEINKMGMGAFQLKPGVVTINRLAEYDGKFKMLITTGRILDTRESLQGTWAWVEVPDLKKLYETILKNGFIHHASMIHGDYTKPIQDACEILGIEMVKV